MPTGLDHAWGVLESLDPEDVCRRALATFETSCCAYVLTVFGQDVLVSMPERRLFGRTAEATALIDRTGQHVALSALCYLAGAGELPPSGRLVKPNDLPGGDIYERGTHVLPLDRMAEEYGDDTDAFVARGCALGGQPLEYADASVRLFPFPRIPMAALLWARDPEFAPRASLLVDETCRQHLPVDIVWSAAMMTVLVML